MSDHTFEKTIIGNSLFQIYSTSECPMSLYSLYSFSQHSTAVHSCSCSYTFYFFIFISSDLVFKVKGCLFSLIDNCYINAKQVASQINILQKKIHFEVIFVLLEYFPEFCSNDIITYLTCHSLWKLW